MRVETEITIEDFRTFCAAISTLAPKVPESNPGRRRAFFVLVWIAMVLLDLAVIRVTDGPVREYFLFGGLLVFPFLVFFVLYYAHARRALEPLASGDALGPKSYDLTDDSIVVVSRHSVYTLRWTGILSVEETPHHLFLFTDRCMALIVPKRSFDSPAAIAEFKDFSEAHARGGALTPGIADSRRDN